MDEIIKLKIELWQLQIERDAYIQALSDVQAILLDVLLISPTRSGECLSHQDSS